MYDVRLYITREDGETFTIDGADWRIPNGGLDGWHTQSVDLQTFDLVSSDGAMIIGEHVGLVDRTIECEAREVHDNDGIRRNAEAFFLPKMKYKVELTYMGKTRCCDGVQSGFMLSMGNVYKQMSFTWTISCPDPYFYDTEDAASTTNPTITGKFGFPYDSMELAGEYAEVYSKGFVLDTAQPMAVDSSLSQYRVAYIDYDGDIPSYPKLVAKSNVVTNRIVIEKLEFRNGYWTTGGMTLEVIIADIYSDDEVTIDLSKSPIEASVKGRYETVIQKIGTYTLITSGRKLNKGLNAYAIRFGGTNTSNVNSSAFNVYAKRLYTGV